MKRRACVAAVAAAVVGALAAVPANGQSIRDPRLRVERWASGLSRPTTFAFLGPGELLVVQKDDGIVRRFKDGVDLGTVLDLDVMNHGCGGSVAIAADPGFATNRHVYVMYSATSAAGDSSDVTTWVDHRLVRFEWNGAALVNPHGPIVAFPSDPAQSNETRHAQGPIRFGPDGAIYGQVGDHYRGAIGSGTGRVEMNTAGSGSALAGGIFRVAPDGTIPADNPFAGDADAALHPWWSYGLRNAFGLTFDRRSGALWDTENGAESYDEINLVPAGMNSGWILVMGPDARDATYVDNGFTAYDASDLVMRPGASYVDPLLSFRAPIGITALAFLHSKRFPPDLRDELLFGDTNHGALYLARVAAGRDALVLDGSLADGVADSGAQRDRLVLGEGFSVITDLQVGPDGYVYLVEFLGGAIHRLRPLVDTIEPARLDFLPWTLVDGSAEDLDVSDDVALHVVEGARARRSPPFSILAQFQLNAADPTALMIALEDRAAAFGSRQDVHARNVVTGAFELVDSALLDDVDAARTIPLAVPEAYVDPTSFVLELRIEIEAPGARIGLAPRPPVEAWIDLLQVLATYP